MTTISPSERSYIISGLSDPTPTRLDGRRLHTSRPISISYGDAPQASGSSRVIIGGTEVLAGIRLEVGDVEQGSGKWRCSVEVDVTPQAFPHLQSSALSLMSTQLASMISDHFIPSIPPIPILPPIKFFIPSLHLTVLSHTGALPAALTLAARSAFLDLAIPKTKVISTESALENQEDLSGIKAAVKRKGLKGKKNAGMGAEWELDGTGGGVEKMKGAEGLPVLVTLNLVPGSEAYFLDATPQEELACPDRLHAWFSQDGKVCGVRLEGESGLETSRIKPLLTEAKRISEELFSSLRAMADSSA